MKLFKISQNKNNRYDTYDSAVVCAENEEDAKTIHPDGKANDASTDPAIYRRGRSFDSPDFIDDWTGLSDIEVEYIGEAKEGLERGVVVASFNAG